MGFENPAVTAVVSRLADPTVNLAAYGGLVFPIILMVEAPIIMLLAASTALCKDWPSYLKLRNFMNWLSGGLTLLQIILVATPLYYVLTRSVLHAPEEIVGPARVGLLITIPWTWSIAYRRLNQGVLIRFGHSLRVGIGTAVRFTADATVLAVGYTVGHLSGIVIASFTLVAGVVSETIYVHFAVRRTLRERLMPAPRITPVLTTGSLLRFYVPLSLTQILLLLVNPIGSAAMGRMPLPLESLAVWPVVASVGYISRGFGGAYNEVVIALVEERFSTDPLRRFGLRLAFASTAVLAVLAIPAVGDFLFAQVLGLADPLPHMVRVSIFLLLPLPALTVLQSYSQGIIMHRGRTRAITESVGLFLLVSSVMLSAGAAWGPIAGIYFALLSFTVAEVMRTIWLWIRSRGARHSVRERDLPIQAEVLEP